MRLLLDQSMYQLSTETIGAYLTLSRLDHINWQLHCVSVATNFSCSVLLEHLLVFHYAPMSVSCKFLPNFDFPYLLQSMLKVIHVNINDFILKKLFCQQLHVTTKILIVVRNSALFSSPIGIKFDKFNKLFN